jgi:hypothetical protein
MSAAFPVYTMHASLIQLRLRLVNVHGRWYVVLNYAATLQGHRHGRGHQAARRFILRKGE